MEQEKEETIFLSLAFFKKIQMALWRERINILEFSDRLENGKITEDRSTHSSTFALI